MGVIIRCTYSFALFVAFNVLIVYCVCVRSMQDFHEHCHMCEYFLLLQVEILTFNFNFLDGSGGIKKKKNSVKYFKIYVWNRI